MSKNTETKINRSHHSHGATDQFRLKNFTSQRRRQLQPNPFRVSAQPVALVRRYLGKASVGRKKKKHLARKISCNRMKIKETLGQLACRAREGPPEQDRVAIRVGAPPGCQRFPHQA
jgi:hypothetical protein